MGAGRGGYPEKERVRSRSPTGAQVSSAELFSGASVRLCGLKGAAHLNGMTGTCGDFDSAKERWIVRIENGEQKSLKAENLEVEVRPEGDKEAMSEDAAEDCARMASDQESGFVHCDSLASAKAFLEKKESRLEFGGVNDSDERARCLDLVCELLAASERKLRGLSFAACGLTAPELRRLAGALKEGSGPQLAAFGISKNPGVEQGAWLELFEAVPRKVMWLDFGDNQLSDADIAPLIAGLEGREELDKLYIDGNRLRDLSKLCVALPDTGITNLDLGDNALDDAALQDLAVVLLQTVVTILVLGTNPISKDGVSALFEMLPRSSLDTLYLDNTAVDDDCLQVLGGVLSESKLTELHIDSTKITDEGVRALLPHLASTELTYIDISGNNISDETTTMLESTVSLQRGGDGLGDDTIAEDEEGEKDGEVTGKGKGEEVES